MILAAALLGACVAALPFASAQGTAGLIAPAVFGLFSLIIMGRFFGSLSALQAILLCASPLAMIAADWLSSRRMTAVIRLAAGLAPVAIAAALAFLPASNAATGTATEPSADDYKDWRP